MRFEKSTARDTRKIKLAVQLPLLVLAVVMTVNHYFLMKGWAALQWLSSAYLHYVCPICGIPTLYQFITSATPWVEKLRSPVAVVLGIITVSSVVLGPVFCGWICPFGTYQDMVAKLGKRIFKRKYNRMLPSKWDKQLKVLRPVALAATVLITAGGGVAFLEYINPYHSLLGLFVGAATLTGLVILVFVTAGSLFVQRPWCRYLCPYGGLLGLFNLIKPYRIVRNNPTCIHCHKCDYDCPLGIKIESGKEVRSMHCTSCLDCTSTCPVNKTLVFHGKETEEMAS